MAEILFVDMPQYIELPPKDALYGMLGKHQLTYISSEEAADRILDQMAPEIIISNCPHYAFFHKIRSRLPKAQIVLATDQAMKQYSESLRNEEDLLVDHIIAMRSSSYWSIQEIRITIDNLLHPENIFGIERYLTPGTLVQRTLVTGSKDRETLNHKVMQYASHCRMGQHAAKMAFGITEELLMNTIHDAPLAAGITHYADIPRTVPIELKPDEYGELSYGSDGRIFAIGVSDPFGALAKPTLYHYLKKVLRRRDSIGLIDTKKGGAGLGFFKILYSSHSLVCNVDPGQKTEIIALIDINEQLRDFSNMARSIHYFSSSVKL